MTERMNVEPMTIFDNDEVVIRWRTPGVVAASVRDPVAGIVEVRHSGSTGWTCTACGDLVCHHISAVKALVAQPLTEETNR